MVKADLLTRELLGLLVHNDANMIYSSKSISLFSQLYS